MQLSPWEAAALHTVVVQGARDDLVLQNVKNAKSSQTVHSCTISSGIQQPEALMRGDKDQKCSFVLYDLASCFSMAAARMDTLSRRRAPASQRGIYISADQSS